MRVTQKKTMQEYDEFTRSELQYKIPLMTSSDPCRRSGASIYDYSVHQDANTYAQLRPSVHSEWNRETDLGGKYVLLSDHFFYFGNQPVTLPEDLLGIVKKGPGHKANFDPQYVNKFIYWMHSLGCLPINGEPQMVIEAEGCSSVCGSRDREEDEGDLAELEYPSSSHC